MQDADRAGGSHWSLLGKDSIHKGFLPTHKLNVIYDIMEGLLQYNDLDF